ESACSAPFSVTLDLTAPVVTVDDIATINEGDDAVVTGTVDDPSVTTVEIFVDGVSEGIATVVAGAFSFNVSGLAVGDYDITVRATDAAGNDGESTKPVEVNAVQGISINSFNNPGDGGDGS